MKNKKAHQKFRLHQCVFYWVNYMSIVYLTNEQNANMNIIHLN
jgi:hypothetical protein